MSRLPPFQLHRPSTVEEASALLLEHGEEAAAYAGGTELVLLMKLGLAGFGHLVDVKRIPELRELRRVDGRLRVGAAVTHRELERSELVRSGWPSFAVAESLVGNLRVRNVGTLGGNLCFADPHSDSATHLLAVGAELVCQLGSEQRRLPLEEFFLGPLETALRPAELLVAVEVAQVGPGEAIAHEKLAFHERPAVTVATWVKTNAGRLEDCRIAVGSVGPRPIRATEAEALLRENASLEQVSARAAEASQPLEDSNGSAEYKAHLVGVLLERCLASAQSKPT